MSLTVLIWFGLFGLFSMLAMLRPAWGIALYLMTFYASPHFWWWGDGVTGIIGDRVNLTAALVFAVAVLVNRTSAEEQLTRTQRNLLLILLVYALNATFVHLFFAANPARSFMGMTMLWKQVGLLLLIVLSVRDARDVKILIGSIIIGTLYIAYEIVINDRGRISQSRLEGVGAPGAAESNYLAGLMLLAIPLAGYWLFFGSWKLRALAVPALVLIFEVILRCNSRGAFLATMAAGGWLLISARGRARKYALYGVVLGVGAAYFMIGDQDIIDRFSSTFASGEERDHSAESRINFWRVVVRMIAAHPVGSGAEAAFKSDLGAGYISAFYTGHKAVHQGYLDIAAAWGLQGFLLYMSAIVISCVGADRRVREARRQG
ncbi:MAG: O-antigen ligase family protein, partial [Planctomycetaceae bacterium]